MTRIDAGDPIVLIAGAHIGCAVWTGRGPSIFAAL
jgi:hypothetical protein